MTPAYALYRRSTTQQDLSIEEQRTAVRAWAEANGYGIIREFADSGSGLDTERRRDFLKLMELCTSNGRREADTVLCYDVSRFSRLEPDEAGFHEFNLRRAGVRVIYTHDAGANEAGVTGQLVKSLKRVLAHEFSQKLSQVVQRGLRAHAALGHWVGGRPPFGYRRAVREAGGQLRPLEAHRWKAKGETVVLVVDPAEARIVLEEIYTPYIRQGLGVHAIADRLNRLGIPAPASHRRCGAVAWTKGTVWQMLRNPIYRGQLVYGKARYREVGKKRGKAARPESERIIANDAAPVIVPPALWEAAQAVHGRRHFATGRPWHRPYLLSGLVECAHCGKRFHGQRRSGERVGAYYVCGGAVASGPSVCTAPKIATSYLEDAVVDGIQKRLDHVVNARELRRRLLPAFARPDADPAPEIEKRLVVTTRKIGRLVDALTSGADELPSVRVALVELERERALLEGQLAAARQRRAGGPVAVVTDMIEQLIAGLGDARRVLATGEPEERKALVRVFLGGIRIESAAGRAVLRWHRVPQAPPVKLVAVGGIEPPTRGL